MSAHELRTAAVLSGEPALIKVFSECLNPHTERAKQNFGPSVIDHPKFETTYYKAAKHANFTDLNLGGAEVLQATILRLSGFLFPMSDCRNIVARRATDRPALTAWQHALISRAHREGHIELPFTGHSRCYLGDIEASKVVNFPVQAIAAITVWHILHEFYSIACPDINDPSPTLLPFLNHYDAIVLDCKTKTDCKIAVLALDEAVAHVESNGYWNDICDWTGFYIPLAADWKTQ